MPLEPGLNAERLEAHARLLVTNRSLSQDEAAALDLGAIEAFWISGVGQKILACGKAVHREVPFTARFSPQDLAGLEAGGNASDLEGEFFVTRGVVDLAVVLPRELWLVDFKTDRIEAHQLAGKVQIYGRQLKLYGLALGRIYGRPVTFRWLHFLNAGATVEV